MAVIGKNILDNLTTGMYSDSKVIYREYIQNACDQIDIAKEKGILSKEKELIDIYIDNKNRYISIKDNATGVKKELFKENLGDIANSNKKIGENKGFRGIGRLCGLAYCKILKFSTSYKGENIKSIMTCDAKKMRDMLIENKKYTLEEIWDEIVTFTEEEETEGSHYFEVEMLDINHENTDLLDYDKIREYLSFVAPVPYKNTFIYRSQVYSHASELNYKIDEYNIKVNGRTIFKEYGTRLKESSGKNTIRDYDEITRLKIEDFYDDTGKLIAWMWYGLSRFEKQIPKINKMRGIRLRSSNIQIGNDDVLQNLFKESRGNYYFVGEVFAVDEELIPNSQRNYFNENKTRVIFEDLLREYFYDNLHKIYNDANTIKNAYKKQKNYLEKVEEYENKVKENGFIDNNDEQRMKLEIEDLKKKSDKAKNDLNKFNNIEEGSSMSEVYKSIWKKFGKNVEEMEKVKENKEDYNKKDREDKKEGYVTGGMSKLTRKERKLVSKILNIIKEEATEEISQRIISRIKEEMK